MTQEKDGTRREHRQGKKNNVLLFSPSASKEKEKLSHDEMVNILLQLDWDDAEYERRRNEKAKEWGITLSLLDRLRKRALYLKAISRKLKRRRSIQRTSSSFPASRCPMHGFSSRANMVTLTASC